MVFRSRQNYFPAVTVVSIICVSGLTSCASGQNARMDASSESAALISPQEISTDLKAEGPSAPASKPQLIKRADIEVILESVDAGIEQVTSIVRAQQGDILELQDQRTSGDRRHAYLRLRVPQAQLETTLAAIGELGTVERRSITAEDVSNQLVDLQARLRNLRKSEEALLKIMDRSGSVADVLEVARELSHVREMIEQIDAQLKNLQTQVSYSSINLSLTAEAVTAPSQRPLAEKVGTTWQQATQSVSALTVSLLQIGLWLLVYSPYLIIVLLASVLGYRFYNRPARR